jgi:hypothetical protein
MSDVRIGGANTNNDFACGIGMSKYRFIDYSTCDETFGCRWG